MRNIEFANDQFYHVYNRGVLKNNIFLNSSDYARFTHYLYEFNSNKPAANTSRKLTQNVRRRSSNIPNILERLVDIICFCLMPNHFHLILRQLVENGIRKFMQRVETGHAKFFNKKYNRSGVLYEGRFKAILIDTDEYLTHLSRYIHLNPVDLIVPGWKEHSIKSWESVNKFLNNYKWSSYLDYTGKNNFPSILNKEPMGWYFKTPEAHKRFVQSWIDKDFYKIKDLILE